ncbi:MAG TPA: thioesterase [Flavobacteriales bacterium]|nr:thioesterase [Flavobacteriales bacterium]
MSGKKELAEKIMHKMYDNDPYSQWLGIECLDVDAGHCTLKMVLRDEMLNGFGIAHGSITFALADSALAFASNGHGKHCVSIDTQISHTAPCGSGDVLLAEATEIQRSKSLARYDVHVKNDKGELRAHFRGTVFIKDKEWII